MNLQTKLVELPGVTALCKFTDKVITLEVGLGIYASLKRCETEEDTLARAHEAIEMAKKYVRKKS